MTDDREPAHPDADARAAHLADQYDDAEKLRIRIDTHERFSERRDTFFDWMLPHIAPEAGLALLDIGSGPGVYHSALAALGVRVIATDQSAGMTREVHAQAARLGLDAGVVRADAVALPFAGRSFDRVMANHMLYYVEDQKSALEEMRRVLRPGGRVILATNAANTQAALDGLHERACRALGYVPGARDGSSFTLSDFPLVQSVFASARVYAREDAFVFREAAPAIRYYGSGVIDVIVPPPEDNSHRAPLLALVGREIEEIIARDRVFRVAKNTGCFVAEV